MNVQTPPIATPTKATRSQWLAVCRSPLFYRLGQCDEDLFRLAAFGARHGFVDRWRRNGSGHHVFFGGFAS
jgi:hypothetical protein